MHADSERTGRESSRRRLASADGRARVDRRVDRRSADARRALRRLGDGERLRLRAPALEAPGRRLTRDVERLTGAVAAGALVVGGGLLATLAGWHGVAGDVLLGLGLLATVVVALGALRTARAHVALGSADNL